MFIIENTTFHVTRGDMGSFRLSFKDYTFQVGDEVELKIYNEEGMDAEPLLDKLVIVAEESDNVLMELTHADTSLGLPSNERETYWYEITLNDDQTPFCYDKNGPKLFYIYPGGVD